MRGLKRRLAGDLDSILLTALSKEPERRYASAEQLSADIRRHLEGLPVTARKATFAYWAGKFVRRHKLETFMAALVLAAILGFSFVTVQLRNRATLEQERAEEVADFLVELFQAPNPENAKGRDITAREILDQGRERIRQFSGTQPQLYASLASTMAEAYYGLGLYENARELFEEALLALRDHLGDKADPQLAESTNNLAAVLRAQGHLAEAEARMREALAMKIRLFGNKAPEVVSTLNNIATLVKDRGALEEAEQLYRRALRIRQGYDPPVPADIATSEALLGTLLLDTGDYQGSEALLRSALETRLELLGKQHTRVALVQNNLAIALQAQDKAAESEARYREALEIRRALLDEHHPDVAVTQTGLASLLASTGQSVEAEALTRQAIQTLRDKKPGHWRIAHAQSVRGSSLAGLRRFEEAESLLLKSYPILVKARRECTRYTIEALQRTIDLYQAWGRQDRESEARATLAGCTAGQGRGS